MLSLQALSLESWLWDQQQKEPPFFLSSPALTTGAVGQGEGRWTGGGVKTVKAHLRMYFNSCFMRQDIYCSCCWGVWWGAALAPQHPAPAQVTHAAPPWSPEGGKAPRHWQGSPGCCFLSCRKGASWQRCSPYSSWTPASRSLPHGLSLERGCWFVGCLQETHFRWVNVGWKEKGRFHMSSWPTEQDTWNSGHGVQMGFSCEIWWCRRRSPLEFRERCFSEIS